MRPCLAAGVVVIAYVAFNYYAGGRPLPGTFYAKSRRRPQALIDPERLGDRRDPNEQADAGDEHERGHPERASSNG